MPFTWLLRLVAVLLRLLEASFSELFNPLTVLFIWVLSPLAVLLRLAFAPFIALFNWLFKPPTVLPPWLARLLAAPLMVPLTVLGFSGMPAPLAGAGTVPGVMGMGCPGPAGMVNTGMFFPSTGTKAAGRDSAGRTLRLPGTPEGGNPPVSPAPAVARGGAPLGGKPPLAKGGVPPRARVAG